MSFHGVPRYTLDKGDPYHCECQKTGRLLAATLGLEPKQFRLTFQSRFGRAEWLQPYTDKTLEALGREGVKRVDVVAPGFTADCLETLEELAIDALGRIALENLGGWVSETWDREADEQARQTSKNLAMSLGAQR